MASYRVVIETGAARDLREVPFPFRRQINQRIYKLKNSPYPPEAEVLLGGVRWLQIYGWHLVYEVDDSHETLTILAIL